MPHPHNPNPPTAPLQQALRLAASVVPQELTEGPTLEVYAFQMYGRALRLGTGAEVLLREHLSEEALFLGRSLFEDSLRLADLVGDRDRRQSLLLGWALASLKEGVGLAHTAVEAGLETTPTFMTTHMYASGHPILNPPA